MNIDRYWTNDFKETIGCISSNFFNLNKNSLTGKNENKYKEK